MTKWQKLITSVLVAAALLLPSGFFVGSSVAVASVDAIPEHEKPVAISMPETTGDSLACVAPAANPGAAPSFSTEVASPLCDLHCARFCWPDQLEGYYVTVCAIVCWYVCQ